MTHIMQFLTGVGRDIHSTFKWESGSQNNPRNSVFLLNSFMYSRNSSSRHMVSFLIAVHKIAN